MNNVRRTAYGFQLYTRVRGRGFVSEHWKGQTPPTAMQVRDWKHLQHARGNSGATTPEDDADGETLGAAVARYLPLIATMPTLRWRTDDLNRWLDVFGADRGRASISAADIRAQLERWRADGYAASTVNHRRTALMHLWTVLDGKSAPNPARDVPRYADEEQPPSALSAAAIDAALDAMPAGLLKAWLVLMRWTGWPQAQVRRLTAEQIRWNVAVFIGRKKGKGVKGRWVPLIPQAWMALRAFTRLRNAAGDEPLPETWELRTAFRRAATAAATNRRLPKAVRAELADVTPYQLRHSFGTLVAATTQDERAEQELLIHSDIRQTRRYTSASVAPRTAAAVAKVARTVASRRRSLKSRRKSA